MRRLVNELPDEATVYPTHGFGTSAPAPPPPTPTVHRRAGTTSDPALIQDEQDFVG
jgi:hypothetical protein